MSRITALSFDTRRRIEIEPVAAESNHLPRSSICFVVFVFRYSILLHAEIALLIRSRWLASVENGRFKR